MSAATITLARPRNHTPAGPDAPAGDSGRNTAPPTSDLHQPPRAYRCEWIFGNTDFP